MTDATNTWTDRCEGGNSSLDSMNGFLDLIFYQTTSIAPPGLLGVAKNWYGPIEFNFRESGCNHEVLKELEAKTSQK